MLSLFTHPYAVLLARLTLGAVFLVSGSGKAIDRQQTVRAVIAYDILPQSVARIYGHLLPWVELTLAGLLLLGLWTNFAALSLGLLLISFAIAVSINLLRGREMECGCFGRVGGERIGWHTLGRIGLLLFLTLGVSIWNNGYFSLDGVITSVEIADHSPPLLGFLPVLISTTLMYFGLKLTVGLRSLFKEHTHLKSKLLNRVTTE